MSDFIAIGAPALIVVSLMLLVTVRPMRSASVGAFVVILGGGLAVIAGIVLLAIAWLEPMIAGEIAACEATDLAYDCEDAGLIIALPLLSGALSAVLWITATLLLRLRSGAPDRPVSTPESR